MKADVEALIELDGDGLWTAFCRRFQAIDTQIIDKDERGDNRDDLYLISLLVNTQDSIKEVTFWLTATQIYQIYDEYESRRRLAMLLYAG